MGVAAQVIILLGGGNLEESNLAENLFTILAVVSCDAVSYDTKLGGVYKRSVKLRGLGQGAKGRSRPLMATSIVASWLSFGGWCGQPSGVLE